MKNDIDPVHRPEHEIRVADVAFDHRHLARRHRCVEILQPPAGQVVEHNNLVKPLRNQAIRDMRANQACPTGDQRAFV
jgi:hypothetical protein